MRTVISNPAYHLLWFPSIWIEVIFHTQGFGELYLLRDNRKAVFWGCIIPFGVFATPSLTEVSPYAHYFFITYVIRLVFELARLSFSKLRNKTPHANSMSGASRLWLLLFPNLRMVSRVVEPLITVLLGIALITTKQDQLLGILLCWCALAMSHKFYHLDKKQYFAEKDVDDRKGEV